MKSSCNVTLNILLITLNFNSYSDHEHHFEGISRGKVYLNLKVH